MVTYYLATPFLLANKTDYTCGLLTLNIISCPGFPFFHLLGTGCILLFQYLEGEKKETWIQPLGWEDPLEEGMETHSSILAWKIPMDRRAWQVRVHGVSKTLTQLSD